MLNRDKLNGALKLQSISYERDFSNLELSISTGRTATWLAVMSAAARDLEDLVEECPADSVSISSVI